MYFMVYPHFSASCFSAKRIFGLITFHLLNIFKLDKMQEIADTVALEMRLYPRESEQYIQSYKQNKNKEWKMRNF